MNFVNILPDTTCQVDPRADLVHRAMHRSDGLLYRQTTGNGYHRHGARFLGSYYAHHLCLSTPNEFPVAHLPRGWWLVS
jgi:hypothetical protein